MIHRRLFAQRNNRFRLCLKIQIFSKNIHDFILFSPRRTFTTSPQTSFGYRKRFIVECEAQKVLIWNSCFLSPFSSFLAFTVLEQIECAKGENEDGKKSFSRKENEVWKSKMKNQLLLDFYERYFSHSLIHAFSRFSYCLFLTSPRSREGNVWKIVPFVNRKNVFFAFFSICFRYLDKLQ